MPTPHQPGPDEILTAMSSADQAHVSVSRGALPFVVPCGLSALGARASLDTGGEDLVEGLLVESSHPSVVRGAERGDIAAVQVEAHLGEHDWSLSATGPLRSGPNGPWLDASDALLSAECLSSPHGHSIDPLLRSGLAERA